MAQFWGGILIIGIAAGLGWWGTQLATDGWKKWHEILISESAEKSQSEEVDKSIQKSESDSKSLPDKNKDQEKFESPSLYTLFKEEFPNLMRMAEKRKIGIKGKDGEKTILIGERLYLDFLGKSKFIGYYIPIGEDTESFCICAFMAGEYHTTIENLEKKILIGGNQIKGYSPDTNRELKFTGRIYIYHENSFTYKRLADLEKIYKSKGLSVVFRGPTYLAMAWDNYIDSKKKKK